MQSNMIKFQAASRQGSRDSNQDNLRIGDQCSFIDSAHDFVLGGKLDGTKTQVVCVCDGIGGGSMGEKASARGLYAIKEFLKEAEKLPLKDLLLGAAQAANERVVNLYRLSHEMGGTTLVMAGIRGREYAILNIGDSPVFHYRRKEDQLVELSQRHNAEWEKRRKGLQPAPDDCSKLSRCLGLQGLDVASAAHLTCGTLEPGDALLLCSDGISEVFTEAQLNFCMKWKIGARLMTWYAARKPGSDNSTALRLDV